MNERDKRILQKIISYCDRIADNLIRFGNSYEVFCNDVVFQDACCMCVLQIGELAGALSEEFRKTNPVVPWRLIKDTRNVYVHAYGSLDLEMVWATLTEDIPVLQKMCRQIQNERPS